LKKASLLRGLLSLHFLGFIAVFAEDHPVMGEVLNTQRL
jgi:hypothetical protein